MSNSNWKHIIDRMALTLGLGLMFLILLDPFLFSGQVRPLMGHAVQTMLGPLPHILPFHVMLFVMAAITGLYASLIQKYTMDWELMHRVQNQMKNFQKEFKEAQLADNQAKLKKMEAQRAAMMEDQMKMSKQQFKPMAYISIISLPLFMWAWLFISEHPDPILVFPFWGEKSMTDFALGPIQYWIYWYFICSLPISQIIRKSLNIGGV
jgi:uncharacterized membrane protein (DUF106 family)